MYLFLFPMLSFCKYSALSDIVHSSQDFSKKTKEPLKNKTNDHCFKWLQWKILLRTWNITHVLTSYTQEKYIVSLV